MCVIMADPSQLIIGWVMVMAPDKYLEDMLHVVMKTKGNGA
jgi:hypothetical protein